MDTQNSSSHTIKKKIKKNRCSASARRLVRGAADQLRYPCRFNDFVKEFQKQEGKLIRKWNDVHDRVKNSKTQVINLPVVHAWLEREANPLKGNVKGLLEAVKARTNKDYCFFRCPNWIWRYRMAKKLSKKQVEVENCIKEGDMYIKLEDAVSSPDKKNFPSEIFLSFDSRDDAYKQLMEALKDDNITMVGLYGKGGCGKTTMAMELKRSAEAGNLFNEVHFVNVSNNKVVEVRSIQDKIVKVVRIPSLRGGVSERAQGLYTRLSLEHKRILLILDDVRQELDFGAIGIPSGQNHKNCKIVITTRSEAVCAKMNCERKIHLSILTNEEARALFQKHADISEGTSDNLRYLARLISDECEGLPVVIAALAGTLKYKPEMACNYVLNKLKGFIPKNINEEDLKNPYKCLQVSYDNLETEEAKSLLLLCSAFPEDTEIPVENLTRFAVGLGLVGEGLSYEYAREEVREAMDELISSGLLSLLGDDNEGEWVKMHDLVRDVVLLIASEKNMAIKCLFEEDDTLECSSIKYLWCKKFPNRLNFYRVEFLFIETNLDVSDKIFKGMERLKVLILCAEGGPFGSLSKSMKSLRNLRTLFLDYWELSDFSFLEHMTELECLMLHRCSFSKFPDVVTQLSNLRLLRLTECQMKGNPLEVIGRYPQLEELYFNDAVLEEAFDNGRHEELPKVIYVDLENSCTFQRLTTLEISGCDKLEVIFHASILRCLPELQYLGITTCGRLKQIIEDEDKKQLSNPASFRPYFPMLAALIIKDCDNMKRLFCVSASNDLPNLEFLMIVRAGKMEELIGYKIEQGDEIGKKKVELPELQLLVLEHLSSLCQGIELSTLTARLVHDCPKLSLTTSIATLEEFKRKLFQVERVLLPYNFRWKLLDSLREMHCEAIKSSQPFTLENTEVKNHEGSAIQKPSEETGTTIEISQGTEEKIKEGIQKDSSTLEDTNKRRYISWHSRLWLACCGHDSAKQEDAECQCF